MVFAVLLKLPSLGAMELSAVALEQEARCGQAEHAHTQDCYYRDMLICGQKAHFHSENCYLVLLADNDINWLLTTMEKTEERSLENVIDSAMVQALALNPNLTSVNSQQIQLAADSVSRLNTVIAENHIEPAVILNENLQDNYLSYIPPAVNTEVIPETEETVPSSEAPTESTPVYAPVKPAPVETTEAAEPTEFTEATTQPTEPVEVTEPTEPVDETQPTESDEVTEPTEPVEVTQPTVPTEVTQPTEPVEVTQPTVPTEVTQPTVPIEVTQPTVPTEATQPTELVEVTQPTVPTEVTQPTAPTEVTQPTEPDEVTQPTESTEETEPAVAVDPVFRWEIGREISVMEGISADRGQVALYLYHNGNWCCIDILDMDQQNTAEGIHYSIPLSEIHTAYGSQIQPDPADWIDTVLYYAPQSPAAGIEGIEKTDQADLNFGTDDTPRHFYLTYQQQENDLQVYTPVTFHAVTLDRAALGQKTEICYVLSGIQLSAVCSQDYLWLNEQGETVSAADCVTSDLRLYAQTPETNGLQFSARPSNEVLYALDGSGVAPAAVGGTPTTGTRKINFYIRLDGQNTFVNSADLTYNNDYGTQSRKEYCSYTTAVNAYTSGTGIVTGLSTGNLGRSYYFRHSTNTNFNTTSTFANNNIYFNNTNNTQYAILSTRSGNSYSPVDFYTVRLDLSGVGETDRVQYVESGMDATLALEEEYLWYLDEEGMRPASQADIQNISAPVTLYARPGIRTVSFETNGGSTVEPQSVRYGGTAQQPEDPVREGFVLEGWYADEALTSRFDFTTPITDQITLYAKWAEACTVSFVDAQGGTVRDPVQTGVGMELTLPEHYTWTSFDGQVYQGGDSVIITGDTVFIGVIDTYTVTFYSGSEVHAVLENVPWGTTIALPQDPLRGGHRFMGWYTDEAYTQAFYRDDPIVADMQLHARWGFDVILNYLDLQGDVKKNETLSCSSGQQITLPEHYTWTDPGADPVDPADDTVYPGGATLTVLQGMSLIGTPEPVTVTYVDADGNPLADPITMEHGSSFFFLTPPEGYVWQDSEGNQYVGGDYYDSVASDLVFTAIETSASVHYRVNFPAGAVDLVDQVPTLYGTDSATATDTVAGGSSVTVRSLTSNTARREVSTSNKESVTYYFQGWQVAGTDVVIPADTVLSWTMLSQYADSDGNVNLVGQWEEGSRVNSVTFFVRFDSVAMDTEGNIGSHPVENYTYEIFNTHLGGLPSTNASELKQFEIADTTADNSYTADQEIRALYGERADGIWMYEFPHDDDIFAYLKEYLAENPDKSLTVNGVAVKSSELDDKHYAIRWYVFKLEGSTWHVDGKLVPREGLLNVYKDFEGEQTAITQAETGFYILAENGTREDSGAFTPYDPSHGFFKQYILTLDQATGNSLKSRYPNASVAVVSKGNAAEHTYFWQLRGITLDEIWRVTEFPNGDIDGYSHYAEYSIYDSDGELTAIAEYGTRASVVGKTFALDEDPDQGMTVEFTNYYYNNNSILLKKEDAATGTGIGGAGFNFIQKDNILNFAPGPGGSYSQNPNVSNTDILTDSNGYVTIDGFSYQYGADNNQGERGRILIQESIVPEGYGWAATVELGLDGSNNVYIAGVTTVDGTPVPQAQWSKYVELPRNDVLIIKNHVTDLTSVTARKLWSTNVPADSVQVVLQANGQNAANTFPGLKNAQVKLSGENSWTYTWENLPRYAGGQLVQWGIKEVVIGNAPTLSDGVSFANWIPVYSSGTGTDRDSDGDIDNWSYTVTNYSKSPKLIVTKVGIENEGLPGAVFTLEQVELAGGSWQRVSGTAPISQTTDANGMLTFENLVGTYTYRLTEVKAPTGHIILMEPLVFTVDGDGNIQKLDDTGAPVPITSQFLWHGSPYHLTVKNLITVELPETGGHGSAVYWLCGIALMMTALLLYKLPMRKEDGISS
ncbi:MAG: InlB B-repeat-containing protein [Oscillospiraceae bacterium]|nr:InlB B-repeat-containing protein [Oscillospiraceae bacterium]